MSAMESDFALPCPLFEGSEKRLVAEFAFGAASPVQGLRALSRGQLDELLQKAACCIVSCTSNEHFDAYVLSESSLFVYPERLVLKTCGTTELLAAVPTLLKQAAGLDMSPSRVKYSRASFLFPEKQPAPYHSFEAEVAYLDSHVGHLGGGGSAYVLGDALRGLQWHIYTAAQAMPRGRCQGEHSIEVCMTDLCPNKAAQFYRGDDFVSARHTTNACGIAALLPTAHIDEYVFEPCGYSMNGLQGDAFSTIHITPEAACSYASVELTGCPQEDVSAFVSKAAAIFNPGKMTICLTVAANGAPVPLLAAPAGYTVAGSSLQSLAGGDTVMVHSLLAQPHAPIAIKEEESKVGAAFVKEEAAGKVVDPPATAMEEDDSSASELTGLGMELLRQMAASRCASEDGSVGGPMCCASYASSQASDGRPATPESALPEWMAAHFNKVGAAAEDDATGLSKVAELLPVLARYNALPLTSGDAETLDAHLTSLIRHQSLEDPVCVVDLGVVVRLYRAWVWAMPRVTPFYAVKCNNDEAILSVLAALGAGFDCASDAELEMVLRLRVPQERIVFANACKRPRDIRAAAAKQVSLTTFDTESELAKLARWHSETKALLRIRADDPAARCQLGNKYGANPEDAPALLQAAKAMGIDVRGVSFHVGSGATNPAAFSEAIALARAAFDAGAKLGFTMDVLDIGGGFCAGAFLPDGSVNMGGVPSAVNEALAKHFPEPSAVRIIAEPGRYFAEACATLACMVVGVRDGACPRTGSPLRDYWITDGLYGSMNSLLYDHATVAPRPLRVATLPDGQPLLRGLSDEQAQHRPLDAREMTETLQGKVFGPTCDGLDTVLHEYGLPRLEVGDWLVFANHGAYTFVGACPFNGMDPTPATFYVYSDK